MTLEKWYLEKADRVCAEAARKYKVEYIGFKIYDDISGENITNDIDYEDWNIAKVQAVTIAEDHVRVWVTF